MLYIGALHFLMPNPMEIDIQAYVFESTGV
jgi:hypothetical protein